MGWLLAGIFVKRYDTPPKTSYEEDQRVWDVTLQAGNSVIDFVDYSLDGKMEVANRPTVDDPRRENLMHSLLRMNPLQRN